VSEGAGPVGESAGITELIDGLVRLTGEVDTVFPDEG